MTDGRAAWNVVTSFNDGEAMNMGHDRHVEHDLRYDMADEFMEIVLGHWDAWEDGAIVQDKESGMFAHPDKVHRLDYKGRFFKRSEENTSALQSLMRISYAVFCLTK